MIHELVHHILETLEHMHYPQLKSACTTVLAIDIFCCYKIELISLSRMLKHF